MPHTNKKPPAPPAPQFKPGQFVNVSLSVDDVFNIKLQAWHEEEFNDAFSRLCMDGYKTTLRYDQRNQCYAAWLLPTEGGPNDGYILSGRGSTPFKALKQLAYIHYKLLEGRWDANGDQPRDQIDD